MVLFRFPIPVLLAVLSGPALPACDQAPDSTLSVSLQLGDAPSLLFPGMSTTPVLEVVLHPNERSRWDQAQVRFMAASGGGEVAAADLPVRLSATLPKPASLTPGQWRPASSFGLGTGRATVPLRLEHLRTSGKTPLEIRAEVEVPGLPPELTGPISIRCVEFVVTDLRDPADAGDDTVIRNGDTAWLTHFQDASRALPIMPRLIADTPGLPSDHTVQWRLETRYARRGDQDVSRFPPDGWLELPGDQSWKAFATYHGKYFGGDAKLSGRVVDPDGKVVFEATRSFRIRCQNPPDTAAVQYVKSRQGRFWFAWGIAQHESRQGRRVFNQYNEGGRVANEPNFGPPDGWGLFQIDSARGARVSTAEVWDWRTNAQAGFDELVTAERDTRNYFAAIQRNYPRQYEAPPATYTPPGCTTVLTAEEASIMQCYNGAAIVRKLRNAHGTLSYYRSCWGFDPSAPAGKRWRFVKNRNNYVYKVVRHELEGGMPTE